MGPEAPEPGRTPVVGDTAPAQGGVLWTPRFPLRDGTSYRASWLDVDGRELGAVVLAVPAGEVGAATRVLDIFPSGETIPENLLRVYIQFSGAVASGHAAHRVELLRADGTPIEDAFVLPEQELWSPAHDRLTLLFDPGRVKREVGPNVEMGAPLLAGDVVTLRVQPDWPHDAGRPLVEEFSRTWTVTAADRTQPKPIDWEITSPTAPDDTLRIEFQSALDRGLLASMFRVRTAGGESIEGTVSTEVGERSWSFAPAQPWRPGSYEVIVDADLEDPAGNSIERLFDEPLREIAGRPALPDVVLPFEVR